MVQEGREARKEELRNGNSKFQNDREGQSEG